MTKMQRPGALESARAGEKVFIETLANTTFLPASQSESMAEYQVDRWLIVSMKTEGCHEK